MRAAADHEQRHRGPARLHPVAHDRDLLVDPGERGVDGGAVDAGDERRITEAAEPARGQRHVGQGERGATHAQRLGGPRRTPPSRVRPRSRRGRTVRHRARWCRRRGRSRSGRASGSWCGPHRPRPPRSTRAGSRRQDADVGRGATDVDDERVVDSARARTRRASSWSAPSRAVRTGKRLASPAVISVPSFWVRYESTVETVVRRAPARSPDTTRWATLSSAAFRIVAFSRSSRPSEPIWWLSEIETVGAELGRDQLTRRATRGRVGAGLNAPATEIAVASGGHAHSAANRLTRPRRAGRSRGRRTRCRPG